MKKQELINELIERINRILAQEECYTDLSLDVLSIDNEIILSLDDTIRSNLCLLNKLLHERNCLMIYDISSCLNSPEFYYMHEDFTSDILTSLITYLDKELDTLSRIRATYDNLHYANVEQINQRLQNSRNSLINELNLVSICKNQWTQLTALMFP